MKKRGFSLIEVLIVLAILMIFFAMTSIIVQSLHLTTDVMKQNRQYEAISHIYSYLVRLENAIVIFNDFSNDQFLYQLPLLDAYGKLIDPISGGEWYSIKLENNKLFKTHQISGYRVQVSPDDIYINDITFSFDNSQKQLRVTMDLYMSNYPDRKTRSNIVVNMLNIVNRL